MKKELNLSEIMEVSGGLGGHGYWDNGEWVYEEHGGWWEGMDEVWGPDSHGGGE